MDIAMILLIFAGICDLFDGFIARKCKRNETQKQFGIQIDSLVDVISFLVFPAIILLKMNTNMLLLGILYLITGVTRLAWFNIHTDGHTDYYQGLPVTFIAFFAPIIYSLNLGFNHIVFPILYSIISLLFVLNIPIKKPKSLVAYLAFIIIAVGVVVLIVC
jgi:CDP-diacylglycerol--serine O-phosphatidyltransferase